MAENHKANFIEYLWLHLSFSWNTILKSLEFRLFYYFVHVQILKLLFLFLCRKVPPAPHQPPADPGRLAAISRGLQPGSDVLAKPRQVRSLAHLQPGESFLTHDPPVLLYILTYISQKMVGDMDIDFYILILECNIFASVKLNKMGLRQTQM